MLDSFFAFISEPARKRKMYVFLVCLFCSAVFWLFIKLSRDNQATFNQAVALRGIPESMILLDQSAPGFSYTLQTAGVRLLISRLHAQRDTMWLDVSSLPRMLHHGETQLYITNSMLAARLNENLELGRQVLSVRPDTLFFGVVEGKKKKFAIHFQPEITFRPSFGLYGDISIEPDSVTITGPESVLDTITGVFAENVQLLDVNQRVEGFAALVFPDKRQIVSLHVKRIRYTIPVEEYTEYQIDIPLGIVCPDSIASFMPDELKLFPNRVRCVFLVALKDYQMVRPDMFYAHVLCPGVEQNLRQLEVIIDQFPDYMRLESVRPASVDYLIMKNNN